MTPPLLKPFHQQAGDELGGDDLGRAGEEDGGRWSGSYWKGVVAMGVALWVSHGRGVGYRLAYN